MTADVDVQVESKGYAHPEDGRVCFPTPDTGWTSRIEWKGQGEAPEPGQRVFQLNDTFTSWDRRTWPCDREHPEQPPVLPMVAVIPSKHTNAKAVHLYLPGYRPARSHPPRGRHRDHTHAAMCAAIGISTLHWNIGAAKDEPTGREHWPVSVAAHEIARGVLRWCPACVGRAAEHFGVLNDVVRLVLERDLTPADDRLDRKDHR